MIQQNTLAPGHSKSILGELLPDLALRVCNGSLKGQIVRLNASKCTIGSAPSCTLRLCAPGVEPWHCVVLRGRQRTIVRRLAAPTRLNHRPFRDAELAAGDRLTLGPVELEVLADEGGLRPRSAPADLARIAELRETLHAATKQGRRRLRSVIARLRKVERRLAEQELRRQEWQAEADRVARQRADLDREQAALQQSRTEIDSRLAAWEQQRASTDHDFRTRAAALAEREVRLEMEQQELESLRAELVGARERLAAQSAEQESARRDEEARLAALQIELRRQELDLTTGREWLEHQRRADQAQHRWEEERLARESAALVAQREELSTLATTLDARWKACEAEQAACAQRQLDLDHELAEARAQREAWEASRAACEAELAQQREDIQARLTALVEDERRRDEWLEQLRERESLLDQRATYLDQALQERTTAFESERASFLAERQAFDESRSQWEADSQLRKQRFDEKLARRESEQHQLSQSLQERLDSFTQERDRFLAWSNEQHAALEQRAQELNVAQGRLEAEEASLRQRIERLAAETLAAPQTTGPSDEAAYGALAERLAWEEEQRQREARFTEQLAEQAAAAEACAVLREELARQAETIEQERKALSAARAAWEEERTTAAIGGTDDDAEARHVELLALADSLHAQREAIERRERELTDTRAHDVQATEQLQSTLLAERSRLDQERQQFELERDETQQLLAIEHDRLRQLRDEIEARQGQLDRDRDALQIVQHERQRRLDELEAQLAAQPPVENPDTFGGSTTAEEWPPAEEPLARIAERADRDAMNRFEGQTPLERFNAAREETSDGELTLGNREPLASDAEEAEPVVERAEPESAAEVLRRMGLLNPELAAEIEESPEEQPTRSAPQDFEPRRAPEPEPRRASPMNDTASHEEDDINSYMTRLLERHGSRRKPEPEPEKKRGGRPAKPTPPPKPPEPESNAEAPAMLTPREMTPRSIPPESIVNLSKMRELANLNARTAVHKHLQKKSKVDWRGKLLVLGVSIVSALYFAWHFFLDGDVRALMPGIAIGVVLVYWCYDFLRATARLKEAHRQRADHDQEQAQTEARTETQPEAKPEAPAEQAL